MAVKTIPAATAATLMTTLAVGLSMALSATAAIRAFEMYGYSLFIGVPFAGGLISTFLLGHNRELRLKDVFGVSSLTGLFSGVWLFALGTEGIICILMSAPLSLPVACLGGLVAASALRLFSSGGGGGKASVGVILPLWLSMIIEPGIDLPTELVEVTTEVEISADAMTVWDAVVSFPEIEEPLSFPFNIGIAHPTSAVIDGEGVGAIRKCEFNTGDFVEPITVWEVGRRLEFDVTACPPPMVETSIYANLDLPHLHGTFESKRGRFLIEPGEKGTVKLIGTTWYTQKLWPQFYWNRLADPIIHSIHKRVLRHIKKLAETRSWPL